MFLHSIWFIIAISAIANVVAFLIPYHLFRKSRRQSSVELLRIRGSSKRTTNLESELENIIAAIEITNAKLRKAEDEGRENLVLAYSATLTEQQKEKNILLASSVPAPAVASINPLDKYLFKEKIERRIEEAHFTSVDIGKASFPRKALVSEVRRSIERQQKAFWYPPSVYMYGMRGSGKSVLLTYLARQLKDEGYVVYFFQVATQLREFPRIDTLIPEDESIKVAFLIDEVQSDLVAPAWTLLLKNDRRNLLIIGAGVSTCSSSDTVRTTAIFRSRVEVNLVLPNSDDSQLGELISYWQTQVDTNSNTTVEAICKFLCDYCGGNFYATSKFSEYAFSNPDGKVHSKNLESFQEHFWSAEFNMCSTYEEVRWRCLSLDTVTK